MKVIPLKAAREAKAREQHKALVLDAWDRLIAPVERQEKREKLNKAADVRRVNRGKL